MINTMFYAIATWLFSLERLFIIGITFGIFIGLRKMFEYFSEKNKRFYLLIVFISFLIAFGQTVGKNSTNKVEAKEQNMLVKMISETIEDATTQVTATVKPK
jgi:uncharacterized membrane protein